MRDVAADAGVAVQTVHVIFGTKLRLAQGIVDATLEDLSSDLHVFIARADQSGNLEVTLRTVAEFARHVYERFADVLLFLQQAGDPQLTAEGQRFDALRLQSQSPIAPALANAGALRADLTVAEAGALIWALSSPEWYALLVQRRGWSPARWQHVVGDELVRLLLARPVPDTTGHSSGRIDSLREQH
jgi:AcrR family transcriptional regulator